MTRAAFVIPGDINLPTGGYAYDRQVLARLGEHGIDALHVGLAGSYPDPTKSDLAEAARVLAGLPDDRVLLIDGLAYGAMPGDLIAALRQKIVALVHHPLCLEAGLAPMRARYLQQTEQMALALAEHVVVTSPTTAATLVRDFAVPVGKITVAVPGTDAAPRAKGTWVKDKGTTSPGAKGSSAPVQVLAVGSIVPRKAYDVLALALRHVPSDLDWRLTIVGAVRDEAARAKLDAALAWRDHGGRPLSDRVAILGGVDDAMLATLYAAADVFVLSSLYEGFGMVLTEAMARGLPIVCTTGGAVAETVPDAAAVKVLPGDASALGQALAQVMTDDGLRSSLAAASWSAGGQLVRWTTTAELVAGVLKRVGA